MKKQVVRLTAAALTFLMGTMCHFFLYRETLPQTPTVFRERPTLQILISNIGSPKTPLPQPLTVDIQLKSRAEVSCAQKIAAANSLFSLKGIEVITGMDAGSEPVCHKLNPKGLIVVDGELGMDINNLVIVLHTVAGTTGEYRIEERYETSLTYSMEGPHLDLLDWKHYVSDWRLLKEGKKNQFHAVKYRESDQMKFPRVSTDEIIAAVERKGGSVYASALRGKIKGSHDPPLGVGISKLSFRVRVKEGMKWRVIQQLDLMIPMGC